MRLIYNFILFHDLIELWQKTQKANMPEIARFYRIIVNYFLDDYPLNAIYSEYVALFNIDTLEMIENYLPNRAKGVGIK